jgi:hypothetical protein
MNPKAITTILAQRLPLDPVDEEIVRQNFGTQGTAWEVSVTGRGVRAPELGQALGAVLRGWLANVRMDDTGSAPNDEQRGRLIAAVIANLAISVDIGIQTGGPRRDSN